MLIFSANKIVLHPPNTCISTLYSQMINASMAKQKREQSPIHKKNLLYLMPYPLRISSFALAKIDTA